MQIEILGCSAGIGGERRTTSILVNQTLLIDAGSGIGDLTIEHLLRIDQVLLTHAHLDHCALLPMLADLRVSHAAPPLSVAALPEVLATLRDCMFNGRLWPDYTRMPDPARPWVQLQPLQLGQVLQVDELDVTMLPAVHSVPAAAYLLADSGGSFAFSGDTALHWPFWQLLAQQPRLRYVMAELTYPDSKRDVAAQFGHLCATDLARGAALLPVNVELLISHLDPGVEDVLMGEILALLPQRRVTRLRSGMRLDW